MKALLITVLSAGHLVQAAPAPQGLLNGISNFLTNTFGGGGNAGEVDDYENAPYNVIQTFDVSRECEKLFAFSFYYPGI